MASGDASSDDKPSAWRGVKLALHAEAAIMARTGVAMSSMPQQAVAKAWAERTRWPS